MLGVVVGVKAALPGGIGNAGEAVGSIVAVLHNTALAVRDLLDTAGGIVGEGQPALVRSCKAFETTLRTASELELVSSEVVIVGEIAEDCWAGTWKETLNGPVEARQVVMFVRCGTPAQLGNAGVVHVDVFDKLQDGEPPRLAHQLAAATVGVNHRNGHVIC